MDQAFRILRSSSTWRDAVIGLEAVVLGNNRA
jgi:hypothetical protein